MPADPNTNKLDYAGLTRYHGKIQQQLTQQSQHIASLQTNKADKLTEDARYAKHETEIKFLIDAAKGQIAEVHTDSTEAYSKTVPTYTSAQAKFVDVKKIGGHSEVVDGEVISADCDAVKSVGKNIFDNVWESGWIDSNGNLVENSNRIRTPDFIKIKPSTQYYFYSSNNDECYFYFYNTNKNLVNVALLRNESITTSENVKYFKAAIPATTHGNIDVYEGSSAGHIPYFSSTLNIPDDLREDYPLRSAGTAYDYLLFKQVNGSLKVEHHGKMNAVNCEDMILAAVGGASVWSISAPDIAASDNSVAFSNIICSDGFSTIRFNAIAGEINRIAVRNNNTIYINNGSATEKPSGFIIYEKANEIVTDVTSYFPADTITYLPVEDGGSLTFHQDGTEFVIPNEEDFYYKLEASA